LPLTVLELLLQSVEYATEFRDLSGAATIVADLWSTGGRRLVEVELAAIEAGEAREAAAERIEADEFGVERAHTRGDRIDLSIELAARRQDVRPLLLEDLRDIEARQRPRQHEAADHEAQAENGGGHQHHCTAHGEQRLRIGQVEVTDAARAVRDELKIHAG